MESNPAPETPRLPTKREIRELQVFMALFAIGLLLAIMAVLQLLTAGFGSSDAVELGAGVGFLVLGYLLEPA